MVTLDILKPGGQIKGWNTCVVWEPRICPTLHGGSLHPPKSILVTSEHWVWSDLSTSMCDPKPNQLKWWCSEDWIICFACRRPQRRLDFWHHIRLHTGQSSPPPALPQIQWGAQDAPATENCLREVVSFTPDATHICLAIEVLWSRSPDTKTRCPVSRNSQQVPQPSVHATQLLQHMSERKGKSNQTVSGTEE